MGTINGTESNRARFGNLWFPGVRAHIEARAAALGWTSEVVQGLVGYAVLKSLMNDFQGTGGNVNAYLSWVESLPTPTDFSRSFSETIRHSLRPDGSYDFSEVIAFRDRLVHGN